MAKNKTATINPKNKHDNVCFKYAFTVAPNNEKIRKNCKEFQRLNPKKANTVGKK